MEDKIVKFCATKITKIFARQASFLPPGQPIYSSDVNHLTKSKKKNIIKTQVKTSFLYSSSFQLIYLAKKDFQKKILPKKISS